MISFVISLAELGSVVLGAEKEIIRNQRKRREHIELTCRRISKFRCEICGLAAQRPYIRQPVNKNIES